MESRLIRPTFVNQSSHRFDGTHLVRTDAEAADSPPDYNACLATPPPAFESLNVSALFKEGPGSQEKEAPSAVISHSNDEDEKSS